jgi:hypothetical protein
MTSPIRDNLEVRESDTVDMGLLMRVATEQPMSTRDAKEDAAGGEGTVSIVDRRFHHRGEFRHVGRVSRHHLPHSLSGHG